MFWAVTGWEIGNSLLGFLFVGATHEWSWLVQAIHEVSEVQAGCPSTIASWCGIGLDSGGFETDPITTPLGARSRGGLEHVATLKPQSIWDRRII